MNVQLQNSPNLKLLFTGREGRENFFADEPNKQLKVIIQATLFWAKNLKKHKKILQGD